mmetsp:Transcript_4807/g.10732  ORF Transcript_4807/g.10732 Transcript_4807/m.10732 type:complete len:201 (-) Transcript_4807:1100-1702(-)
MKDCLSRCSVAFLCPSSAAERRSRKAFSFPEASAPRNSSVRSPRSIRAPSLQATIERRSNSGIQFSAKRPTTSCAFRRLARAKRGPSANCSSQRFFSAVAAADSKRALANSCLASPSELARPKKTPFAAARSCAGPAQQFQRCQAVLMLASRFVRKIPAKFHKTLPIRNVDTFSVQDSRSSLRSLHSISTCCLFKRKSSE